MSYDEFDCMGTHLVPDLALYECSAGRWGEFGDAIRNLRGEGSFPPPKPRPFRLRRRP